MTKWLNVKTTEWYNYTPYRSQVRPTYGLTDVELTDENDAGMPSSSRHYKLMIFNLINVYHKSVLLAAIVQYNY